MTGITLRGMPSVRGRLAGLTARSQGAVERAVGRATKAIEADVKRNSFTAKRGAAGGLLRPGGIGGLAVNTGEARASITSQTFRMQPGARSQTVAVIGSPIRWLPIHEYGGVIRGRPWLAIPTIYAKRYAGRPTRIFRSKRGTLFVWAMFRRAKPKPVKMLLREVRMPARAMFGKSVERMRPAVAAMFQAVPREVVR